MLDLALHIPLLTSFRQNVFSFSFFFIYGIAQTIMTTHVSVSTQQESTTVNMYIISNYDGYISALLRHSTAYRESETK